MNQFKQAPAVSGRTARKSQEKPKGYNAHTVRRCVRRTGTTPDGIALFESYSMTREGREVTHHSEIDLASGSRGVVRCSCENFTYRRARFNPTLATPGLWCKHLERAVEGCERRGELEVGRDCDGVISATPTGYSFDFAPLVVDADASTYDVEHDAYLAHLAECIEADYNA